MPTKPELPTLEFADPAAWERWLEQHHESSPGVWLKIAKKGAPAATVDHPQALEQAIRFGWIDGQKRGFDEHYWLQRFTPRGPRSKWSQVNRDKALELIAADRMTPAGLAQFEAARGDGRLEEAYEPQSRATVPEDFQQRARSEPGRGRILRDFEGREPVRVPVSAASRQEARGSGQADRDLHRDAVRRADVPLRASRGRTSTAQ